MQPYHHHHRLFFPNYPPPPPPPIPTRESIINEGLKDYEQSKMDEQWLKVWIDRKKSLSIQQKISLSTYRERLIEHAKLLEKYEQELKIDANQEILNNLKNQIEQSNKFLYDDHIIKNIQKDIYKRKLKRKRLRRQKEEFQFNNQKFEKKEKSLNEKIQDIESILRTIEQLKILRRQATEDNNNELTEIENECQVKLLEYQTEMKNQAQSQFELYNYLFNNNNQSFYETINPDAQYLLRAHQNRNDLIQIRRDWDQYSRTNISSFDNIIPVKWHEPQIPSDSNWTKYIFNKNA